MNEYAELDRIWCEETTWWDRYMHAKPIDYKEEKEDANT